MKRVTCDICGAFKPTKMILQYEELIDICEPCWEAMLVKAGE